MTIIRTAILPLLLASALSSACGAPADEGPAGRALTPPGETGELPILPLGGEFTLTDQDGQPFSLSSLRGHVALVFFGYTMCPDACPTTLSKLSTAHARLTPEERARVKTLYITIDPERDTPAVMKEHLTYFGVDAIGLSGTPEQTSEVASQFGAHFERTSDTTAAGYLMSHTVSIFGLDAEGRTRLIIDYEAGVDLIVREVRALLAAAPGVDAERARQEAQVIFREVMSPYCPGLTLADCPSPAAFERRREIDARLQRGESRQAIVDELVAQYGTALLSDPSDTPIGRIVWGVPIVLSILAALGLALFVRRATYAGDAPPPQPDAPGATASVRMRLDEELTALD